MNEFAQQLVFHGSIILLLGVFAGVPYARAILKKRSENTIHIWRIAHLSLPIGAILLFAIAPFITSFDITNGLKWAIVILFIVSMYAFGLAMFIGAPIGERGLTFRGSALAKFVHINHMIGVITSLVASIILVYAAWVSL